MPNQFFSPEGDLEEYFATDYWLFEQYIGNQLWGMGSNGTGQIGVNDISQRNIPAQEFSSSTNWKQVAGGTLHSAAIKTDGTLWLWGRNSDGGLGVNDTITRSTPVQEFTSSTNWKQVSCSNDFTAAIKTDGTLWTWGRNNYGTLGINLSGVAQGRTTPVQEFTSSTSWNQISQTSRSEHIAAIKTDGTLWLWGRNNNGQIGVNDTSQRNTPVQEFSSSTNWKQVSGGSSHTAAIKTDGTLWLWGNNIDGRLGVNDRVIRSTPVQEFTSSTNWKQVSCGFDHTAAIKTDGTLWSWGRNVFSVLGVNDTTFRSTPVQEFTSSTNWKQVSCGSQNTEATKTDGTLWGWGINSGRVGDNTTANRSTPRQEFTSSTNWKQVSSGDNFTLAVKTGIEIDTGTLT